MKIVQNFKKMSKNLSVLNLPNEGDRGFNSWDRCQQWALECGTQNQRRGKIYKYCSRSFNKAECNYPTIEKEILTVIRGIEKFSIFLTLKPFLIQTDCKGILGFVKKNLSNM